ncbi:MAG TPA: DUF3817 domain-containing protein [Novosphingobium sp.]|nr:DUF3817 domain-containing protein [Novosphingobium sp.]
MAPHVPPTDPQPGPRGGLPLLRWLEIAAAVEATTLLLLMFVAVPLKHLFDWPLGVRLVGPLHGLAFVAFCWTALHAIVADPTGWPRYDKLRIFLGTVIPLGGYWNLRFIARKARRTGTGN